MRKLNVQLGRDAGNITKVWLVDLTFEVFRDRTIISRSALEDLEREFAAQCGERSVVAHGSEHAVIVRSIHDHGN